MEGAARGEWDDHAFERTLERLRTEGTIDADETRISSERLARILEAAPEDPDRPGRRLLKHASFVDVTFGGRASFEDVTFQVAASFVGVTFEGPASFHNATFQCAPWFSGVVFQRQAVLRDATFERNAAFIEIAFQGDAWFDSATFQGDVSFLRSTFENARDFGPVVVREALEFEETVFAQPIRIEASARAVSCPRAQFHRGADLLVRWAEVGLDDADFAEPSLLAPRPDPVEGEETVVHKPRNSDGDPAPRVVSVRRAKIANLTIAGADLRACRFEGAHGLDQLRLERVRLAQTPSGWQRTTPWPLPIRWTRRQTIAEEHQWRAERAGATGWYGSEVQASSNLESRPQAPEQIAATYRALRKGREDGKDEPGAADFYYGEMEMRRQRPLRPEARRRARGDRPADEEGDARLDVDRLPDSGARPAPRGERLILWLYWLVSGYGLRASRALIALAVTVVAFAFLFDWWGFRPDRGFGRTLLFSIESTSSLFRVPETEGFALTAGGEVLQVVLRLLGPLFFGLALLSLRGRVKR